MVSVSIFFISLSGITSLLCFRLWEMKRGSRLLHVQRKKLDESLISLEKHIKDRVPTIDRTVGLRIYHLIVHYFALLVLTVVRVIEKRMVYVLEHMRGKREIKRGVTQSDFLKRVGDHKKSLENHKV